MSQLGPQHYMGSFNQFRNLEDPMRLALFLLRLSLRTLRLVLGLTFAVIRSVTLILLWMLAPQVCFAAWLLRG